MAKLNEGNVMGWLMKNHNHIESEKITKEQSDKALTEQRLKDFGELERDYSKNPNITNENEHMAYLCKSCPNSELRKKEHWVGDLRTFGNDFYTCTNPKSAYHGLFVASESFQKIAPAAISDVDTQIYKLQPSFDLYKYIEYGPGEIPSKEEIIKADRPLQSYIRTLRIQNWLGLNTR